MADFMEHCRKMSINKNTNETTALKKWPILWKIVGKMSIKKTQNETTALKKWPILWKIAFFFWGKRWAR